MKSNELITQDITSLIKKIAIPSSVGLFFNTMYNVVDTFYVGTISTIAITALSYSFMIYFLLLSISFGLSSAITAHVGNSLGRNKIFLAKIFVSQGISFVTLIAIFLVLLGTIFLEELFSLIGATDKALSLAIEYTQVIFIGVIPMLMGLGINAVLIAKGDTKSYRNTLVVGFFLNLILNPLFIYGYGVIPEFGFIGVAYATVLIQICTFSYIFYKLSKTNLLLKKSIYFLPDFRMYKKLLFQALPMSLNMFMMSIGSMILISFVSSYGYKAVAAFGIGYRVEQIGLLPMLGLNTAVASIVANNYGAKKFDRIFEVRKKALIYGYIMSFIGVIFLVVFGKYIIMVFDNDTEVIDIAYGYIVINSLIFFGYITIFISNSTLQGIKNPYIIPYISLYRQIIMPMVLLTVFVNLFKVDIFFIWIVMLCIVYSAAIIIYVYSSKKLSRL